MSARPGKHRIPIAQALSEPAAPAPVTVAGRALAVEGAVMVLVDASGTIQVELHDVPPPRAGDLVELDLDPATHSALALRLLTPYRADKPFPSPGGEFFQLHHPLRQAGDGAHRAALLARRSRCLSAIRSFFVSAGYMEVETPRRVRLPGLEPHLVAEASGERFLITSPEYHMKRLLAGGLERIYSMGPCWRREEQGPSHLGEFTMLEWYRAYSTLEQLMAETEALLRAVALELNGGSELSYQGQQLDLARPFTRLSFAEACRRLAGVECAGVTEAGELRRRAVAAGLGPFADDDGFDAVASRILVERVEPALAEMGAVFLHAFPAPLSALAQLDPDDPTVAERFELYVAGIELANAFGELTDPEEQRRRLEQDRAERRKLGAPDHPVDLRFIAALRQGMPPSAGIALGVDRLVMLLADAADIRHVVAFPPDSV